METDCYIKIQRLKKIFNKGKRNEKIALCDIDIELQKGSLTAVIGESGAGKSTLLNILSGMLPPTSGNVVIDGVDIYGITAGQRDDWRIKTLGIIRQQPSLLEYSTAFENVKIATYLVKQSDKRRNEITADILKSVGIFELAEQTVFTMSGGEKQRVAIARALINGSELILADEPTGSLDTDNKNKILTIFKELTKLGKTIVLVTHDMLLAENCDKIIHLRDGKISDVGNN